MTIKTRNRLNYFLLIFSIAVFSLNLAVFILHIFQYPILESYNLPDSPARTTAIGRFLFDYKVLAVYISLFFMNAYVCAALYFISRVFEKTQNTEISFFACFLIACLAETSRLYIPMFDIGNTYSSLLIVIGNFSAFSRILAPLSLLFSVIMSTPEQRQNLERNIVMILVISLFFAVVIPLNTGIIEPNFRVHVGYDKTVVLIEILTDICAVVSLAIFNIKNRNNQKTTIGMVCIIAGFVLTVNGIDFFKLALGICSFVVGTYIYLKELHDQHLYD